MKAFGWWLGRALLVLIVAGAAFWLLAPRAEAVMPEAAVEVPEAAAIDAWLAGREGAVADLKDGAEKRVIWAGAPGERTEWAVVYVHGFSATSEESRPMPDLVAEGLGANLHFTRLAGHGVDMDTGGAALAEATALEWMDDMTEAAAVGAAIGDRVLIVTLSTGGTLAALAAEQGLLPGSVAGIVFISPNFRMANPLAALITAPGAEWWLPVIGGQTRTFEPENPAHGEWWTTTYPSRAVFPLGAAVDRARAADYSAVTVPALFAFDPGDKVIDHEASREVAARWGGAGADLADLVELDVVGDPSRHIAAGDILSPEMTRPVADLILRWAEGL